MVQIPSEVIDNLPGMTQNRFAIRLAHIAFYSDLHATRFTLGLAEILWSITLLWPGDTFGRPTYTVMSRVMSEESWGFIFLLSGITQFSILFSGDFHGRFSILFAGWNAALWWFVVVAMYLSVFPPPAAISGELALSVAALWVYIRSGYVTTGRRSTDRGS